MEIEKKRETSWKIQLKKNDESIEMTSVEISGEVRLIKLSLLNNEKIIKVEMNKGEFFNFLSLLSAFKDVVIGEESFIIEEDLNLIESSPQHINKIEDYKQDIFSVNSDKSDESFEDEDIEKLNPEEWDPW